jgi:hypothetical protein
MSYITAYTALVEPIQARLPVEESIESLYDHVDEFVVYDCSKYDRIDLSKYGKVKKHVRGIWNPFDNPFGSMFTQALNLVNSDTALFLDIDEIWEFKSAGLKDIIKRYPMQPGVGIAFSLRNYYCSRNYVIDGCSTKGMHVFMKSPELAHDSLFGYWQHRSRIRRTNDDPDGCDGVRLCNEQCQPTMHYQPIPMEEVIIHHMSHLDLAGKMVRSILQYNHTSTMDLLDFFPVDLRLRPELVEKIYDLQVKEIESGDVKLYGKPIPLVYEGNKYVDSFVKRCNIPEFDPTNVKDYENWKNIDTIACETDVTGGTDGESSEQRGPETVVIEPNLHQDIQPMSS